MRWFCYILLLLLVVSACTTESYESGDGEFSFLRADFSMIQTDDKALMTSFVTDDDQLVSLSKSQELKGAKPDTTYRALIYYRQNEKSAELIGLTSVLVAKPFLSDTVRVMMKDPIGFESAWMSANGSYLNLALNVKIGVADGDADVKAQQLGFALDRVEGKNHYCTLFHDQAGVPEYYTKKTYLSVPLKDNFPSGDSVYININTHDGILRKGLLVP